MRRIYYASIVVASLALLTASERWVKGQGSVTVVSDDEAATVFGAQSCNLKVSNSGFYCSSPAHLFGGEGQVYAATVYVQGDTHDGQNLMILYCPCGASSYIAYGSCSGT